MHNLQRQQSQQTFCIHSLWDVIRHLECAVFKVISVTGTQPQEGPMGKFTRSWESSYMHTHNNSLCAHASSDQWTTYKLGTLEKSVQSTSGLSLLPKLTREHIDLNSYSRMHVNLAAQVCFWSPVVCYNDIDQLLMVHSRTQWICSKLHFWDWEVCKDIRQVFWLLEHSTCKCGSSSTQARSQPI
jgi:hypothetical protein